MKKMTMMMNDNSFRVGEDIAIVRVGAISMGMDGWMDGWMLVSALDYYP